MQGSDEPGTPAATEPSRRTLLERLDAVSGWVKFLGGLLAFGTAILTTVFLLWPNLKPEPTPAEGSADLTRPAVTAPVTFGQYLDRVGIPRDEYSAAQLARVGALATFKVTIKGYEGERLPLRWVLLDLDTNDVVGQESKRTGITPNRQNTPIAWPPVWTELPKGSERFRLTIEIYPPGARPDTPSIAALDAEDSDEFRG